MAGRGGGDRQRDRRLRHAPRQGRHHGAEGVAGHEEVAGRIDRRVLATLEFLAANGLRPTVTSLLRPGSITVNGNFSHHSTGTAVDIAAINGIPMTGNQGAGSITDVAVRRLLQLQGAMKPAQIITLMSYAGADNTVAMADHHDHIHVDLKARRGGAFCQ